MTRKTAKFLHEPGVFDIKARYFINEDNTALFPLASANDSSQCFKSFMPVLRCRAFVAIFLQCRVESGFLVIALTFQDTTHKKVELILEIVSYQGCLTDTPATIQGNEFTLATTLITLEPGQLIVSSYNFVHYAEFSAKVTKSFQSYAKVCSF